jgi:osmotically inducible lipoprotein OsmB
MRSRFGYCAIAMALLLSACGATPGDRAASGAAIGAGAGAVGGAFFGVPFAGAAIGAAAGATVGVATTPSQVDLGKPVWK